ncbi:MAG: hypothetical protein P4L51_00570 [Puia sp.]|nr:hypothetical protein [Puia sp.]
MSISNNPTESYYEDQSPKRNGKNTAIIILAIAFLGSLGYLMFDASSHRAVVTGNETKISQVTDEKGAIQKSFDESLVRLDSMTSLSNGLQSKLANNNAEIAKRKAAIRSILNKSNATAADLAKAKEMIASLNTKITGMEQQIAQLTTDNQGLTQDKVVLTQDNSKLTDDITSTTTINQGLEKKVDIASTLNATNIAITPVDVKKDGREKMTSTAKRVNKLIISFDVNNRIAQSGSTDIYVCVMGPGGKNMEVQSLGSGTFTTREEGDKPFTAKVPVQLDSAKEKKVEFGFMPGGNFQQGNYTIQIYQNGFKIGEATRELKKGGLFS